MGEVSYGLHIKLVTEIVVLQEIPKAPDLPEFIIGVVNRRGTVISVMDMRKWFHMEPGGMMTEHLFSLCTYSPGIAGFTEQLPGKTRCRGRHRIRPGVVPVHR